MIKLTTIVVSLTAIVAAATIPVTVTAGSRSNPFLDDSVREYQSNSAGSRYYYKKRAKKSKKRRKRGRKNKRSTVPAVATENVRVQKELKTAGFYNGPLDGKLDSYESRVAVMQYQLSHGLPQTGELSPDLKRVLLQQGDIAELTEHLHNVGETQHDKGRRLQAALKVQRFYSATIDGDFGPESQAAMRLYQQAKGMTPSGALLPEQEQELVAASIQQIQNQQAQSDQVLKQLASSQPSHQTTPSQISPVQEQPASDQVMDQEEIAEQQPSAQQQQQTQSDNSNQQSEVLQTSSAEVVQHDKITPGASQLAETEEVKRSPLTASQNQIASNSSEPVLEGDGITPVDGDDNTTGGADSNVSEIPGTDQHEEKSDWTCSKRPFEGCKNGALPLPEITSEVLQNGDTSDIHRICRPRDYDCVLKVMRDTGAGNQALRFFEHTGAFVSDFQELGKIDVVSAEAAFAANVIHYELLVNGKPNLVSLWSVLTDAEHARPDIRQLREKGLSLFNNHFVRKEPLAQGSRFIVEADFTECNACRNEVFARAEFAHDVDSQGVYQGYQLLRVLPSSLGVDATEELRIGEIHDTSHAGGCYCSFSPVLPDGRIVANQDMRYLFISSHFSGNAWMNIDGRDVELSATQCNAGTYDNDAGERCVHSAYRASGISVQIDLQATKRCPPEPTECEVTDYDATITVEKEGSRQVVKAKGSCGC